MECEERGKKKKKERAGWEGCPRTALTAFIRLDVSAPSAILQQGNAELMSSQCTNKRQRNRLEGCTSIRNNLLGHGRTDVQQNNHCISLSAGHIARTKLTQLQTGERIVLGRK